jgi:hypothetical protein
MEKWPCPICGAEDPRDHFFEDKLAMKPTGCNECRPDLAGELKEGVPLREPIPVEEHVQTLEPWPHKISICVFPGFEKTGWAIFTTIVEGKFAGIRIMPKPDDVMLSDAEKRELVSRHGG